MTVIRHFLAQRHLAVLLCAAVLSLKLLVPTGYMIANAHGTVTLSICSGGAASTVTIPMPGIGGDATAMVGAMTGSGPDSGPSPDHGKVEMPCAYAGLSAQMIGAVDPAMLVAALAVVAAMALQAMPRPARHPTPYLRPPLRGPPLG